MNWRARGGAGHCVGAFDIDILTLITQKKLFPSQVSLRWSRTFFFYFFFFFWLWLLLHLDGTLCRLLLYSGRVRRHEWDSNRPLSPPTLGPPFCHFSQNRRGNFLNQMVYTVQWTRRKRDPLLPRLPLLLHASWSTHKLWNPKGKIQAKKANALFNNRKEERKKEKEKKGLSDRFPDGTTKIWRKKKEF